MSTQSLQKPVLLIEEFRDLIHREIECRAKIEHAKAMAAKQITDRIAEMQPDILAAKEFQIEIAKFIGYSPEYIANYPLILTQYGSDSLRVAYQQLNKFQNDCAAYINEPFTTPT